MNMSIVLIVLLGLAVVWVITTYNFFVSSKARIKAAVQEIGNQLKRQVDLIPNLESSTKGYLQHEKKIFKDLTDARKVMTSAVKSGDVQKIADAGSQLASVIPSLRIAVEDNPELKANTVVQKMMDELRDTADKITYARRLVIDLTADFNVRRVTFPSSLVASLFRMEEQKGLITPETGEHVEAKEADLKTPKVDLS
jgi:LemA protein